MQKDITKDLKCELTQEELLAYSRQLANNQQDKNEAESGKKSVVADYNDRIARLNAEIQILSRKVANGYEHRPIACRWQYHWENNTKVLLRKDTLEIVETAAITPEERQQELDMSLGDEPSKVFDDRSTT